MTRWSLVLLLLASSAAAQSAAPAIDGFQVDQPYKAPKKAPPCVTGAFVRMIFRPGENKEAGALPAAECTVSERLTLTVFSDTVRMMQLDLGAPRADSAVSLWRLNRTRLTGMLGRAPDQAAMPMQGEIEMLSMIWHPADSLGWVGVGMFRVSRGGDHAASLLIASCRTPRGARPSFCPDPSRVPPPDIPHD